MYLYLVFAGVVALLFINHFFYSKKKLTVNGKHVVITGGSSGIGKSLGILAAKKGAHVTILARNIDRLGEAQKEIKAHCINEEQIITKVSVDVTDYETVENNLSEVEELVGPIFMLVNCAGLAICGKVEDYSQQQIKQLIDINFLGTLYPTKAVIPKFKKRKEGIIVFTASQVALMGMFGYSIYSSCKFALRGLAESLIMEVRQFNISVTVALPPDTDTPGLSQENKSKPIETQLIGGSGGLRSPDEVAEQLLDDALTGKFFSYIGFNCAILTTLCVGMSPFTSVGELLIQSLVLGPLRLIGALFLVHFDNIIKKCAIDRAKEIKQE